MRLKESCETCEFFTGEYKHGYGECEWDDRAENKTTYKDSYCPNYRQYFEYWDGN